MATSQLFLTYEHTSKIYLSAETASVSPEIPDVRPLRLGCYISYTVAARVQRSKSSHPDLNHAIVTQANDYVEDANDV